MLTEVERDTDPRMRVFSALFQNSMSFQSLSRGYCK